jgi:CCR4-NOT transcription complex subunit 1
MYYHLLNRICMVANPYIQGMIQHFHQYKEDPAAPPHNLPTHGAPALAWRLLVSEAARASRDVVLAPQFANAVLSPMNSTCLPVPSLRLFGLPPPFVFALASYSLAATDTFLPSHPSYKHVEEMLWQAFDGALDTLYTPGHNFWTYQLSQNHPPFSDDLSMQEARTLILATYPRLSHSNGPTSRPPSPTNPTAPHTSCLDTYRRNDLLRAFAVKFNSPAIILQTLNAISPGGAPGAKEAIPLEDMLMELGDLTRDEQVVEAIVQKWWTPWILESDDHLLKEKAIVRTLHGLLHGLESRRTADVKAVVSVLCRIVSLSYQDNS